MSAEPRPLARTGLLATDHSKRGRRYVTILVPRSMEVTLLEPWEHAVLVLCDGSRTPAELVELLPHDIDGQAIDLDVVRRCLKFFERQKLIVNAGLRASDLPPPGPVTVNELQRAYAEWHKTPDDPLPASMLPPPIPRTSPKIPAGLAPTVAQRKGLNAARSLLGKDDEPPIPDLMAAVDDAVAEAGRVVEKEKEKAKRARKKADAADVVESESRPPLSGLHPRPVGGVLVSETLSATPPARPMSSAGTDPGREGNRATEPVMKLADLLAADATEPATITIVPAAPAPSGVRLRDEEDVQKLHNEPTGPMAKSDHAVTQLGPMVRDTKRR